MITVYSFLWSMLTSSILILLIRFLRRRSGLLAKHGTFFLALLIFSCMIRMLLPVELPDFQYVIMDANLIPLLIQMYKAANLPFWVSCLPFLIWGFGIVFWFYRYIAGLQQARDIVKTACLCTDTRAVRLLHEIDPSCDLPIYSTSSINVPLIIGYLHPAIYLPNDTYSSVNLKYILLHEYTHWKSRDVWKIFCLNLFKILF